MKQPLLFKSRLPEIDLFYNGILIDISDPVNPVRVDRALSWRNGNLSP